MIDEMIGSQNNLTVEQFPEYHVPLPKGSFKDSLFKSNEFPIEALKKSSFCFK